MNEQRTRVRLGRRADLGADCAQCVGLCCVALAFVASSDFPADKPAGTACEHLEPDDACGIHSQLRERGFKGCTVFDCFGAGQKVSAGFAGRSWRADPEARRAMVTAFPLVRRLHELLWYLDEAIVLVSATVDASPWVAAFDRVEALSNGSVEALEELDVDGEYDAVRGLLVRASEIARTGVEPGPSGRGVGPGRDLAVARLVGADLAGACLRGSSMIAADLRGARLWRCDLLGVDLRDADLSGASLAGAIYLTQMQVNSARGDASTVLPDGFQRPTHWS